MSKTSADVSAATTIVSPKSTTTTNTLGMTPPLVSGPYDDESNNSHRKNNNKKKNASWWGQMMRTVDGVQVLCLAVGEAAEFVPFGHALFLVTTALAECRRRQRVADELATQLVQALQRTHGILQQCQDNYNRQLQLQQQQQQQSRGGPPVSPPPPQQQQLVQQVAQLLGQIHECVHEWTYAVKPRGWGWRCCQSSYYSVQLQRLADELSSLKSDWVLGQVVTLETQANVHAQHTHETLVQAQEQAAVHHDQTTATLAKAAVVQAATHAHLLQLKEWVEDAVSSNALTMKFSKQWDSILKWDWDATAVGVVSDAVRAVAVGVVDPSDDSSQRLLLQFWDTQEEYNARAAYGGGGIVATQRPVWAMAMTARQVQQIRRTLMRGSGGGIEPQPQTSAGGDQPPPPQSPAPPFLIPIHEEPLLENQTWHARAWWVSHPKDGCLGVRLQVQASQDRVPTVHELVFAIQGDLFRRVGRPRDLTVQPEENKESDRLLLAAAQAAHPLPPPVSRGGLPLDDQRAWQQTLFPARAVPRRLDYPITGDSPLQVELEFGMVGATTLQRQSSAFSKHLHQHVTSGKLILRNPTSQPITIRRVTTEYQCRRQRQQQQQQQHDPATPNSDNENTASFEDTDLFVPTQMTPEDYVRQSTFVGFYRGSYMVWGIPHPDVEWIEEGQEWTIAAHESVAMVIKAIIVVEDTPAYSGNPLNLRLHQKLGPSVSIRATLYHHQQQQHDDGEAVAGSSGAEEASCLLTKTLCWDYSNPVLRDRSAYHTYDEYLQFPSDSDTNQPEWQYRRTEGVGDDFECPLWMFVDDPVTLQRYYIVVTTKRRQPQNQREEEDPTAEADTDKPKHETADEEEEPVWYIRAAVTSDKFPSSYSRITASSFARIVYDASKARQTRVDQTSDWSMCREHCKIYLLVDLERQVVYGLEAEILLCSGTVLLRRAMYF